MDTIYQVKKNTEDIEQIKQYNQSLEERIQALEAKLQQNNISN